jgi:hypothetical protein
MDPQVLQYMMGFIYMLKLIKGKTNHVTDDRNTENAHRRLNGAGSADDHTLPDRLERRSVPENRR